MRLWRWHNRGSEPEKPLPPWAGPPRKEERPCCRSRVDELGRYPIGHCSPECLGRPHNWRAHQLAQRGQR